MSRRGALALAAALFLPAPASADWRLAPIVGTTIRTETGFVDLDATASKPRLVFGGSLTGLSSGLFGLEIEATVVPSVFTGHQLVDSSRVLTGSASLVVAVPRSVWRIRPYAVLGVGLVRSTSSDAANLLPISSTQPGFHLGGGVWVPVAKQVAFRGDVRFLRTTTGDDSAFSVHGASIEMGRITGGVAVIF
jgi:outer membrane protein with beta-barrel domain